MYVFLFPYFIHFDFQDNWYRFCCYEKYAVIFLKYNKYHNYYGTVHRNLSTTIKKICLLKTCRYYGQYNLISPDADRRQLLNISFKLLLMRLVTLKLHLDFLK